MVSTGSMAGGWLTEVVKAWTIVVVVNDWVCSVMGERWCNIGVVGFSRDGEEGDLSVG